MADPPFDPDGAGPFGTDAPDTMTRDDASARLDDTFDALSDRRRRCVLYCLSAAADGVAERATLVEAVREFEEASGDRTPPDPETVHTDLRHRQLPRLADAGFVEYDPRRGTVRLRDDPSLREWLEHAEYREVGRLPSGTSAP